MFEGCDRKGASINRILYQPLNYFAKRLVEKISTHIYFAGNPQRGRPKVANTENPILDISKRLVEKISKNIFLQFISTSQLFCKKNC